MTQRDTRSRSAGGGSRADEDGTVTITTPSGTTVQLSRQALRGVEIDEQALRDDADLQGALDKLGGTVRPAVNLAPNQDEQGWLRNYVDGAWVDAPGGKGWTRDNPADVEDIVGTVPESGEAEVRRAVDAAARDFDRWRSTNGDFRQKLLLRLAELMRENADEMAAIITRDMGKSHFDSILDMREAFGVVEGVATQALSLKGETYPNNEPTLVMESRPAPRGPAAIVSPFNLPVAISVAQIAAALVSGNTVVWKPAHLAPGCAHALMRCWLRAVEDVSADYSDDVPSGALSMVQGDAETGDALIRHPAIRTVSFTGSAAVGNHVESVAGGLGKKVLKEQGGLNFFYVHESADLDQAARNILQGKTITSGQRCSSVQEVLVDESVSEQLLERLRKAADEGIVMGRGDGDEAARADAAAWRFSLPPLVDADQYERHTSLIAQAREQGARVRHEVAVPEELQSRGYYVPFVVLDGVDEDNVLYTEEVFGPCLIWRPVKRVGGAIDRINGVPGIVASIVAEDKDVTEHFIERCLRTRIDDGRHGTSCYWATKFGGDRGAGSGNPALDRDMVYGYTIWKTIYRNFERPA